jgi:tRNA pseudouridine65 synthase
MRVALLWRDETLIAIDKPAGLLTHPGLGRAPVTALQVARRFSGAHVFPVHRLDRPTSGVLVFARTPESAAELQRGFEAGLVRKRYVAIVRGQPNDAFTVDSEVPRSEGGPRVPAITRFRTLARSSCGFALVEACPETGRFHQIRRHLAHVSHPILLDANYGKGALNRVFRDAHGLSRLALHCADLHLPATADAGPWGLFAPLPADLRDALASLGIDPQAAGTRQDAPILETVEIGRS